MYRCPSRRSPGRPSWFDMLRIHIVHVGTIKEKYLTDAVAEYEKRIKTLTDKAAKLEKTNAELDSANKAHELNALKNKVARESGLRYELADRLTGTTEEELRADAQKLAEYTAVTAPLKSTESSADKLSAAMQRGAAAMFGGEE